MGDLGVGLTARLTGAILAGGRGSRLGGVAKGLLDVGGQRMIDRVAAALDPIVGTLLVATDADDAASWIPRARIVPDVLAGGGSAAGVHAALRAAGGPVLVVAWDLPFVTSALLRALAERARSAEGGQVDAVVAASAAAGAQAGQYEPACGWYAQACAGAIEREWASGDRSLHGLLRRVRTVTLPSHTIAASGTPERLFFNVNTPADLQAARAMAMTDIA